MPEPRNPFLKAGALRQVERVPPGRYAMWWPAPGQMSFLESEAARSIGRAYRGLDGVETYVLADLLKSLGAVDFAGTRMAYPDPALQILLEAPAAQRLVLTISQEKGIRFHFHIDTTDLAFRDGFLREFAEYAEAWKQAVQSHQRPLDPEWEPRARKWWELVEQAAAAEDARPEIGVVVIARG